MIELLFFYAQQKVEKIRIFSGIFIIYLFDYQYV